MTISIKRVKRASLPQRTRIGAFALFGLFGFTGYSPANAVSPGPSYVGVAECEPADQPLLYEMSLLIPNVPLWPYSDGMALDLEGLRLFATPQGAKSVAVLDLASGKLIQMLPGIGNPHAVAYNQTKNRIFVVDGASGDVKVFDGSSYSQIGAIAVGPGADMSAYDPVEQLFYVNSGDESEGSASSIVSVIDTVSMKRIAKISVPGPSLEGDFLDRDGGRLYVSIDDREHYSVAVVDLKTRETEQVWALPKGTHRPKAITLDRERNRLFVATRDSSMLGSVFAFDTKSGKVVSRLPIGGWTDGIDFDEVRQRIYVSTGVGYVETFAVEGNDRYCKLPSTRTALLAKTSLYSPELDRVFVSVPMLGNEGAAQVMVLRPIP